MAGSGLMLKLDAISLSNILRLLMLVEPRSI